MQRDRKRIKRIDHKENRVLYRRAKHTQGKGYLEYIFMVERLVIFDDWAICRPKPKYSMDYTWDGDEWIEVGLKPETPEHFAVLEPITDWNWQEMSENERRIYITSKWKFTPEYVRECPLDLL